MIWYMLGCILLLSVEILKTTFESWHKVDSRSSYRNDSNDSKIVTGDRRGAQNSFLGSGVRTVTRMRSTLRIRLADVACGFSHALPESVRI